LTEDGRLFQERALEIVSLAEKAQRELARGEEALSGEIAIGSGEIKAFGLLADLIASFKKTNPSVRIVVFNGDAEFVKKRIEMGLLDIGLLLEPIDMARHGFVSLPPTETWGVLIHKDFELAGKRHAEPRDLAKLPLFIPRRESLHSPISNWFGELWPSLDIAGAYNLLYNTAIMAQRKMGAALCIETDAAYENLVFVPLRPKITTRAIVAWKKGQAQSKAAASFLDHVRHSIKA
jgi:DNA-binding transcriptional LysR family regulator